MLSSFNLLIRDWIWVLTITTFCWLVLPILRISLASPFALWDREYTLVFVVKHKQILLVSDLLRILLDLQYINANTRVFLIINGIGILLHSRECMSHTM